MSRDPNGCGAWLASAVMFFVVCLLGALIFNIIDNPEIALALSIGIALIGVILVGLWIEQPTYDERRRKLREQRSREMRQRLEREIREDERRKLEEQYQGEEGRKLREQIRQEEERKSLAEGQKRLAEQQRRQQQIREDERKKFIDQIRWEERRKLQ